MGFLIAIEFLAAAGIILWAAVVILFVGRMGRSGRCAYLGVSAAILVVAFWTSCCYEYSPDDNTRVQGWPVALVVYQRDDANSPWLDYVGFTTLFGLPMNFIIFMFIPSYLFLVADYVRQRKLRDSRHEIRK